MICLTLRLKPIAKLTLYEQEMISWSGYWPMCQAGKFREAISDLPCRGGISSMRRGFSPSATALENLSRRSQMSWCTHPTRYLGLMRWMNGISRLRAMTRLASSSSSCVGTVIELALGAEGTPTGTVLVGVRAAGFFVAFFVGFDFVFGVTGFAEGIRRLRRAVRARGVEVRWHFYLFR